MNAYTAIRHGAGRTLRARRVWLAWYVATVLFALAAALPLAALLARSLDHSLWAGRMLANFDPGWIFETVQKTGGGSPMTSYLPAALALAGGFYLLATFLAGGTIAAFAGPPGPHDAALFWGACGRNFARLLRLALFSAVFYGIVIAIAAGLEAAGERAFRNSMAERPVAIYSWTRSAVVFLLAACVNLVFDYARVRLVVEDRRGAVRAALGSFRFVWRHFGLTAGAYAIALVALGVVATAGHVIVHAIPTTAPGWPLLLLVAQQAFVVGRIGIKLVFYATATGIYTALKAPLPDSRGPEEPEAVSL